MHLFWAISTDVLCKIFRQEVLSYDEMCSKRRLDSLAWLQLKTAMIQGFGLMTTMYGKSDSPKISHFVPQYYSRKIYLYSHLIFCLRKTVIVFCMTKVLVGCMFQNSRCKWLQRDMCSYEGRISTLQFEWNASLDITEESCSGYKCQQHISSRGESAACL